MRYFRVQISENKQIHISNFCVPGLVVQDWVIPSSEQARQIAVALEEAAYALETWQPPTWNIEEPKEPREPKETRESREPKEPIGHKP